MKKEYLLIFIALTLTSCATVFNSDSALIKISANKKTTIVLKRDTISINKKQTTVGIQRSKDPLKISILQDSIKTDFFFNKKLSNIYWLNIFNYGLGALIDLSNNKRFRYQNNIYFITDSLSNKTSLSKQKIISIPKKKILIYTNPLRAINLFSIPTLTLGTEYFLKDNFSLSLEYGTKVPRFRLNYTNKDNEILKEKNKFYRIETKWYNKNFNLTKSININEYIGLEAFQQRTQFNDNLFYYAKNSNQYEDLNSTKDNFATKKRVTVINLKYGLLVPINERFYFDFYTGLGLRLKRFKDIHKEFNPEIHKTNEEIDPLFDLKNLFGTNSNEPNFSLGFKFGIKL